LVPDSAHFAGKHGDGLITVGGDEPDTYRRIIENFEAGAREAGKDPARMPRMIEIGAAYTQDEQKAIELRKAYWAGTFVPALFTERIYTPKMSEDNGKIVGADAVKQSVCISANPEEHVKLAEKYIALGFDHLIFHSAGPDQKAFIEGYGRDVLPRLRNSPQLKTATKRPGS
jgi:coenzyme F420-dependent glucose-6-phosphate dehydrogenase